MAASNLWSGSCRRLPPAETDLTLLASEHPFVRGTQGAIPAPALLHAVFTSEERCFPVNRSKYEQCVLHALAQGGMIVHRRDPETGKITQVDCFNRDGWRLDDCRLGVFRKLKRRRLIASADGAPYRITRDGLAAVRAQLDNR